MYRFLAALTLTTALAAWPAAAQTGAPEPAAEPRSYLTPTDESEPAARTPPVTHPKPMERTRMGVPADADTPPRSAPAERADPAPKTGAAAARRGAAPDRAAADRAAADRAAAPRRAPAAAARHEPFDHLQPAARRYERAAGRAGAAGRAARRAAAGGQLRRGAAFAIRRRAVSGARGRVAGRALRLPALTRIDAA
ncbi:MAG: hypothetical protein U1F37_11725 [Alphaproteobacteria bacterium]